jgi:nucleotide-binding universal stress UspA family protein
MKRILVALDTSPRAAVVLDASVKLARALGAKIHLFRAVGLPPEIPTSFSAGAGPSLAEFLLDAAKKDLEERMATVPDELRGSAETHLNTPWDGICRMAKNLDVDLVVVGSHGYGALDRVIGTTAAKVVNHADRNVLVVRTHLDGPHS